MFGRQDGHTPVPVPFQQNISAGFLGVKRIGARSRQTGSNLTVRLAATGGPEDRRRYRLAQAADGR